MAAQVDHGAPTSRLELYVWHNAQSCPWPATCSAPTGVVFNDILAEVRSLVETANTDGLQLDVVDYQLVLNLADDEPLHPSSGQLEDLMDLGVTHVMMQAKPSAERRWILEDLSVRAAEWTRNRAGNDRRVVAVIDSADDATLQPPLLNLRGLGMKTVLLHRGNACSNITKCLRGDARHSGRWDALVAAATGGLSLDALMPAYAKRRAKREEEAAIMAADAQHKVDEAASTQDLVEAGVGCEGGGAAASSRPGTPSDASDPAATTRHMQKSCKLIAWQFKYMSATSEGWNARKRWESALEAGAAAGGGAGGVKFSAKVTRKHVTLAADHVGEDGARKGAVANVLKGVAADIDKWLSQLQHSELRVPSNVSLEKLLSKQNKKEARSNGATLVYYNPKQVLLQCQSGLSQDAALALAVRLAEPCGDINIAAVSKHACSQDIEGADEWICRIRAAEDLAINAARKQLESLPPILEGGVEARFLHKAPRRRETPPGKPLLKSTLVLVVGQEAAAVQRVKGLMKQRIASLTPRAAGGAAAAGGGEAPVPVMQATCFYCEELCSHWVTCSGKRSHVLCGGDTQHLVSDLLAEGLRTKAAHGLCCEACAEAGMQGHFPWAAVEGVLDEDMKKRFQAARA